MNDVVKAIDPQRFYSATFTFDRLDISPATGYRKLAKGEIRAVKVGRLTKITGAEILRLLSSFPPFESRAADAVRHSGRASVAVPRPKVNDDSEPKAKKRHGSGAAV